MCPQWIQQRTFRSSAKVHDLIDLHSLGQSQHYVPKVFRTPQGEEKHSLYFKLRRINHITTEETDPSVPLWQNEGLWYSLKYQRLLKPLKPLNMFVKKH